MQVIAANARIPVHLHPLRKLATLALLALCVTMMSSGAKSAFAAPPKLAAVTPGKALTFPQDHGAHPDFRTEWWYVTGWLQTADGKPLGFQVTFFRSATDHDRANPSRFAPRQLIIAHVALSDPALGKLLHDQKSAREGLELAYARPGDTDVKLDDWHFKRKKNGHYRTSITARDFSLELVLTPQQQPMLQGERGFSRKGPRPEQASYYYSLPQLKVSGSIISAGKKQTVNGNAWLDHEWSTTVLDPNAAGWDWLGANLDDGSALMAFQIRSKDGKKIWAHAALRDATGKVSQYPADQVDFIPQRRWRSPRTDASYPVSQDLITGQHTWRILPLQDDQELDSRQSTGAVYWEGAIRLERNGQPSGKGYLELTGYVKPLKL